MSVENGASPVWCQRRGTVQAVQPSHLEKQQLQSLLVSYSDTFAPYSNELGTTDVVTHSIDTGDHGPVWQQPPFALRAIVNQLTREMLEQKVIEHLSSPWASLIVLVQNTDGEVRFSINYCRLSSSDVFLLPRIDDTLELLTGMTYFTTLDVAAGYWQVRMKRPPHLV